MEPVGVLATVEEIALTQQTGERGKFLAQSRDALAKYSPAERSEYERKYAVKNLTLQELRRFDVGRLNPDSAYARFFPEQVL